MPVERPSIKPQIVEHIGWVMKRCGSLKEALAMLEPVIAEFVDPAPYAFVVIHVLVNVPTLEKYGLIYRNNRQYLVTDEEILQSYDKEFPAWMRRY